MQRFSVGWTLVVLGVILILIGVLALSGALGWFGRLPGDFRVERPNVRVYFPLASMLVISIILSLLLAILRRFF